MIGAVVLTNLTLKLENKIIINKEIIKVIIAYQRTGVSFNINVSTGLILFPAFFVIFHT